MTEQQGREGQQLGNYQLMRLLGRGGFAEVYLGNHLRLQRQAAIKVLHAHLSEREIEDFQREAQVIAALDHPNIVRILDFDVQNGTPFLVMDYLPNGTLRQLHEKGERIPLPTIISYVKQIAAALQYAHDQRIIHRDVKPENMLVGRRNEIVLSDFGIAAIAHSTSSMTAQASAGTIPYMAPEQIQAQARAASDQYALGIVVYEWLSGERPFNGSFTEICAKHLMTLPPPLHQKISTIPPDVERVISIALAKDPRQRFGNVQAFATALEGASRARPEQRGATPTKTILLQPASSQLPPVIATPDPKNPTKMYTPEVQRLPITVPPPPPPAQFQRRTSAHTPRPVQTPPPGTARRRKLSRRPVIIGIVVAGSGGIAWWITHILAPFTPYIYQGHSDSVNSVAWSPDGKLIASASNDKTVQVWDATNGHNVYTYHGHADTVNSVAWSPNGSRIASASFDKTVHVWDATNGSNVYTYHGHFQYVMSVAWSPDGKRIASASTDNTVQVWDATNGHNVYTYHGHADTVTSVAWSPDGKRIASASVDNTVQVWDVTNGGHPYIYQGHSDIVYAVTWSPNGQRIASGSFDQTVHVWDATNGGHVYVYQEHSDTVKSVAWSPNGQRIASGSADATVRVWEAM